MRFAMSLLLIPLVAGCGSNWGGLENVVLSDFRPYWPDCDGDGLGAGKNDDGTPRARECVNPQEDPPPTCPGAPADVTPRWVANSRDCDDAYALSGGGGRHAAQCPEDYGWFTESGEITSADYEVVRAGENEFLVMRGTPVQSTLAQTICDQWRQGSIPEGPSGEGIVLPVESLATLEDDFSQGRVVESIRNLDQRWVGWVGATPAEFNSSEWSWNIDGAPPVDFGFCGGWPIEDFPDCASEFVNNQQQTCRNTWLDGLDGAVDNAFAPTPESVLMSAAWPFVDSFDSIDLASLPPEDAAVLLQQLDELRLVMVVDPRLELPCLTFSTDPYICPDQVGCFADFVCERTTLDLTSGVYDVFDLDEANACLAAEQ